VARRPQASVRRPAEAFALGPHDHCTFALTDAFADKVKVQLLRFDPPLEHAPDQIASRPFETVNVIAAPVENDADPVLPPAGAAPLSVTLPWVDEPPVTVDGLTDSPDSVTVGGGGGDVESGFTVSGADCVTPPPLTEIVTIVCVVTCEVKMLKPPAVVPLGTTTALLTRAIAG
jgi:hypothetical protein